LLLECSEPGVRLAGRPRCRATQHERHRRAADKRLRRSSGSLPSASGCTPPTASAICTHNWSQRFVAVLLVLLCARCARERSGPPLDDTLSQRELPHSKHTGTLQLHALLHMSCRAVND
jgi:hypothetical protein